MYQKSWEEYLELLQGQNFSEIELLSKIDEELNAVEQWKLDKNTMTRIYPTSANIKSMENYFSKKLVDQWIEHLDNRVKTNLSQLTELPFFLHKFRHLKHIFVHKNDVYRISNTFSYKSINFQ